MFLRFGFRANVGLHVIRRLTLPKLAWEALVGFFEKTVVLVWPFGGSKLVGVTEGLRSWVGV